MTAMVENSGIGLNVERLQDLLSITGGEKLVKELIVIFGNYRPQMMALPDYIHEGDLQKVKFLAHKLKAAAANLGADKLAQHCEFFEESADNIPPQQLLERFQLFQQEFEVSEQELQKVVDRIEQGIAIN